MTTSSRLASAVAAAAALAVPCAATWAEGTDTRPLAPSWGTERTDDPAPTTPRHEDPRSQDTRPHGARPDREAGRDASGRTFAPDGKADPVPSMPGDGAKGTTPDAPQSPPTGDASGGDRRTHWREYTLAQSAITDPDLGNVSRYLHSVGVADARRVNDAAGGDRQPPARRVQGANPPPEPMGDNPHSGSSNADRAQKSNAEGEQKRGASASPSARLPSTPADARATGEGTASPPPTSSEDRSRGQK